MTATLGISSGTRRLALGLAAVATSASIAITWMAGRERGGTEAEQLIWVTVGLSLLLGAHLIPAMTHGARHGIRIVAYGLWAAAMVSTGYTHGTFFLAAQQHAGDVRAGQVTVPGAAPADLTTSKAISALLRQQARVEGSLNQSTLAKCHDDCRALDVRRRTLRSQLDSIKGQLDQARRVERDNDRTAAERAHAIARQDSQRGDPVSTKLSLWLGVPATTIDLAMAIFFGWLLESIACFSWYVALSRPRQEQAQAEQPELPKEAFHLAADSPAPKPLAMIYNMSQPAANDSEPLNNTAQTRIPHVETAPSAMSNSTLMRSDEEEERVLRDALESGAATNSISEIVRLLGCSEGRALTLRRQIAATSPQLLLATHRAVG